MLSRRAVLACMMLRLAGGNVLLACCAARGCCVAKQSPTAAMQCTLLACTTSPLPSGQSGRRRAPSHRPLQPPAAALPGAARGLCRCTLCVPGAGGKRCRRAEPGTDAGESLLPSGLETMLHSCALTYLRTNGTRAVLRAGLKVELYPNDTLHRLHSTAGRLCAAGVPFG